MEKKYKIIRRIRKNGTSLAINIPKEITTLLKLKEGELIEIELKKIPE